MSVTSQERAAGCRASTATTERTGDRGGDDNNEGAFERLTGLQAEDNMHETVVWNGV